MRAFPVSLPSGQRYWTVLDEDLQVVWCRRRVSAAFAIRPRRSRIHDEGLCALDHVVSALVCPDRPVVAGRGGTVRVVHDVAGACSIVHRRCRASVVVAGPGSAAARCPSRINGVLTAVRGMVVHAVATGHGPAGLVSMLV